MGLPVPLPRQLRWQDAEFGVLYHFDMPLYADGGWSHEKATRQTWDPARYNPERLDTDQWLAAAVALGARYAVLTATHFNGFLQWQSDLYPYGVKQARWRGGRGDLVGDFVASCRRVGIEPALYLSCFRNAYWHVDEYRVGYGRGGDGQAEFARTCEKMVAELCSRYGPLFQIWFDAGLISPRDGGPDVLPIIDRYQPEMVFYHSPERREHRWIGNEAGVAGDPCWSTLPDLEQAELAHKRPDAELLAHGDPDGLLWCPGMTDTVLRDHHWVWRAGGEERIEPLEHLVDVYYTSVGRNTNLVLGLTPAPDGLLPQPDMTRCRELGRELRRRFGAPVAETSGHVGVVECTLPVSCAIDHVVVMEDIAHGERVREYVIEGLVGPDRWQPLCSGRSIGHKWIHRFAPTEVGSVRLRVTKSVSPPLIRRLAVYAVDC